MIEERKKELRTKIKEFKRKIEWEPSFSFTRPKLIQDMNLLIGELKGIKFVIDSQNVHKAKDRNDPKQENQHG